MSVKEQMESLAREIEDALVFNKPVLPVLQKANERHISIRFDPYPKDIPHLIRIRLTRTVRIAGEMYVEIFVDPEVVMSSVFYPNQGTHQEYPLEDS